LQWSIFRREVLKREVGKKERAKIQNIHHALSAAVSSINLAKRLLAELETGSGVSSRNLPGEFGKFDGHFMVTESGDKYAVPENYASKSRLVYGDTLKRLVDEDGEEIFKQVERVKRQEVEGILARKGGQWHIVTSLGSFELLPAAVNYWNGEAGDEAIAIIPQEDNRVPFAALKSVSKGEEAAESDVEKEGEGRDKSEEKPAREKAITGKAKKKGSEKAKEPEEEKKDKKGSEKNSAEEVELDPDEELR